MSIKSNSDIAIVGGGIIGICVAAYLAEAGRSVTVYDRPALPRKRVPAMPPASPSPRSCRWPTRAC